MGVKVYKRDLAAFNTITFIMLSIFFYYIVLSLGRGVSVFSIFSFEEYLLSNKTLVFLGIFSAFFIYIAARISKISLIVFLGFVVFNNLQVYFYSFDKIVLIFCFIYILAAIYFFALWQQELEVVVYWPGYSKQDIGLKNSYKIPVVVQQKSSGKEFEGHLTNWGEFECFLRLNDKTDSLPKGKVKIVIDFVGHKFQENGYVITCYDNGIGIKLLTDLKYANNGLEGWADFFTIVSHRGYNPRYVRV